MKLGIIGITRREHESLSAYRFRYAVFCFRVAVVFAILFVLLAWLKLDVTVASRPVVVMFFYFAVYFGLGISIIGGVGFLIGGGCALLLNENQSLKFSALLGTVICLLVSIFCLYWAIEGLASGTTLWAWISRPLYVHRAAEPIKFWYSEAFLFWAGLYLPFATVMWLKKIYSSQSNSTDTR